MKASFKTESDYALLKAYVYDYCEISFTKLVERHVRMISGVARRTLDQTSYKDDVCQLTFLQLTKNAHRLLKHENIAGWLHKTAYQQAMNTNRSHRRMEARHLHLQKCNSSAESAESRWHEIAPLIDQELISLKSADRALIVKRYLEGYSVKELAGDFKISIAATEKRLQRALTKLKKRLDIRGVKTSSTILASALLFGGSQDSFALCSTLIRKISEAHLSSKNSPSILTQITIYFVMKKTLILFGITILLLLWWTSRAPSNEISKQEATHSSPTPIEQTSTEKPFATRKRSTLSSQTKEFTISGIVIDHISGEKIPNATILLYASNDKYSDSQNRHIFDTIRNAPNTTNSDLEGQYVFKIPKFDHPFRISMFVFCPGYANSLTKFSVSFKGTPPPADKSDLIWLGADNLMIEPGVSASINFEMVQSSPISGLVVDTEGFPIQNAQIQLWHQIGIKKTTCGNVVSSEENGQFKIDASPGSISEGTLSLELTHPEFCPSKVEGIHLLTGSKRHSITASLSKRLLLEGTVFDPQGTPLAGAKVLLTPEKNIQQNPSVIAVTNEHGAYQMKLIELGKYTVRAVEFDHLASFTGEVEIQSEGEMDLHLSPSETKKRVPLQLFDIDVTWLSKNESSTFGDIVNGGLLINQDAKSEMFSDSLKKGMLITGAKDLNNKYSPFPNEPIHDLPHLARYCLDFAKYSDDGSASVSFRVYLANKYSTSTTRTLNLSKEDIANLETIAHR